MFALTKDVKIVDLALYIPAAHALVVSDFHLGYEEAVSARGTLIPRFQFTDIMQRLDGILGQLKLPLKTVIINGDLKHEMGRISPQEWRDILKLLDYLARKAEKIVVIKGNHDTMLQPVAQKRGIELVSRFFINGILVVHGDVIDDMSTDESVKTIIIGHEHPALGLKDGARYETFKCFLKGLWKKKTLIVQPSFNPLIEGTDIRLEEFLSPYLTAVGGFKAFVAGDIPDNKILPFGKVRDLGN